MSDIRILYVVRNQAKAEEIMHALPGVHAVGMHGPLFGRQFDVIIVSWYESYSTVNGTQYIEENVKLKLAPGGKLIYV